MSDIAINRQMLLDDIERRILFIYRAFADGRDVAPATIFQGEALIAQYCIDDASAEKRILTLMGRLHLQIFGKILARDREGEKLSRIVIHYEMQRAPVYPST